MKRFKINFIFLTLCLILVIGLFNNCKKDDDGLCEGKNIIICILPFLASQSASTPAPTDGGGTTTETAATPTFAPAAGTYTSAQNVTISSTTDSPEIRYTNDGSDPTCTTGTVYSSTVNVTATTTLKAIACKTGSTASSVASATYTIQEQYTLGGTVSGLTGTLVLTNGDVDKTITANGSYSFDAPINSGSSYTVTVKTQPTGKTCTVSNGSGTISANVSNVDVSCHCGTETYAWGTFTDQCNGTVKFVGVAGEFGGQTYTAQTLTFMKCSQGQIWNGTTSNDCTGTGNPPPGDYYGAGTYLYCDAQDNDCNGGINEGTLGTFSNGGTSTAWDTCNQLNFADKTDWRVPTHNELKTLIHCTDKTMPNARNTGCGAGNSTTPAISSLFPNTAPEEYWSSFSFGNETAAWVVRFSDGYLRVKGKNDPSYVRCVSGP